MATAASGIGISGELNVAAVKYDIRGGDSATERLVRLDSYTSRFAVKGSEDLGGGAWADFLLGTGFRIDEGRGMPCNRECWLRLRGPWGSLRMGRTLTVYDDVSLAWYFQDSPGTHNPLALWANCGNNAGLADGCFDVFLPRTLRYDSPGFAGLSATVSVSDPSRDLPNNTHGRIFAAGAQYASGPFHAGLAHQSNRSVRADGLVDHATTLSISWQGPVYVAAGLERMRYATASGATLTRDYVGLMASRTMLAHTVWANHGRAYRGTGTSPAGTKVNAVQNLPDSGAVMWTLGYQYTLSRQTQFYAFYNRLDNERNGVYTFDPGLPPRPGQGSRLSALAVGMLKRF